MTEQEVINTVCTVIAKKLYKQPNDIKLDTMFTHDLGADSLDMLVIATELSNILKIPINEFEDKEINSIDDLVALICNYLKISRSTNKGSTNIIGLITIIGQKRRNFQKFTKRRSK
jgi:acyl carrier protein